MSDRLTDVYRHRYLLRGLILADLRNRYGASFLGFFWSVIHPLLLVLLYTLVFGYILNINVGGNAGPRNYGLFLFSGMLPWLAVSDAVHRSSQVFQENRDLVKQVSFPLILLPIRCVAGAFIHEIIATAVFIPVLVGFTGTWPSPAMAGLLIALIPLQLLFTLGVALFVSSISVFYKDAREMVGAVLTLWFFISPIVIPLSIIPERVLLPFYANPLSWLITMYRTALLGDVMPELVGFAYFALATLATLIAGWLWFRRLSREFSDLI